MPDYLYADAHLAIGDSALARSFWLTQCAYAAKYEAVHGAPPGMAEDKLAQRRMILNIAHDMFIVSARREMHEAMAQFKTAVSFS